VCGVPVEAEAEAEVEAKVEEEEGEEGKGSVPAARRGDKDPPALLLVWVRLVLAAPPPVDAPALVPVP
jgi:hypothetical protein